MKRASMITQNEIRAPSLEPASIVNDVVDGVDTEPSPCVSTYEFEVQIGLYCFQMLFVHGKR
jgi:hypothetical protein